MKKPSKERSPSSGTAALRANTDALIAYARALDSNTEALNFHAEALLIAASPKGCCTISAPGVADTQHSGLTERQCGAKAEKIEGGVARWVEGSCA